jgi:hypothetical protein
MGGNDEATDAQLSAPAGRAGRVIYGSLLVAAIVWGAFITADGIAIGTDSSTYLGVAHNLAQGNGPRIPFGEPGTWLRRFPPGLSLALTPSAALGPSPVAWARVLTIVLLALNTTLVAAIAQRLAPRSRLVGAVAGALFLVAPTVVELHSELWSEPLYLAFELAAVLVLLNGQRFAHRFPLQVHIAGLLAGLSLLTRFVGVATLAACSLWLLLAAQGRPLRKVAVAVQFGLVSIIPFGVWTAVSAAQEETVNSRGVGVLSPGFGHVRIAAAAFRRWLVPVGAGDVVGVLAFVAVSALLGLVAVRTVAALRPGRQRALVLPVAVGASHIAVTVFVAFFVGEGNFLDSRTLLPAYATILPVAVAILASDPLRRHAWFRGAATALAASVLTLNLVNQSFEAVRRSDHDLRWASPFWDETDGIRAVDGLSADAVVMSNLPDLVWFTTDRAALSYPGATQGEQGPVPDVAAVTAQLAQMEGCGGALLHIEGRSTSDGDDETYEAMVELLGIRPNRFPGGEVVVVPPSGADRCTSTP